MITDCLATYEHVKFVYYSPNLNKLCLDNSIFISLFR